MDDTTHAATPTPTPDAARKRKRRKRKKVLKGLLIGLVSAAVLGAGGYGLTRLLNTEDAVGPEVSSVRFDLKPGKVFLFDAETEERILFD